MCRMSRGSHPDNLLIIHYLLNRPSCPTVVRKGNSMSCEFESCSLAGPARWRACSGCLLGHGLIPAAYLAGLIAVVSMANVAWTVLPAKATDLVTDSAGANAAGG